ncbi:MAG: CAP domain-containing protein [Candidatus Promineofilum sp.]|nr:CAP domain-containing protein [Promineifilum sp.]
MNRNVLAVLLGMSLLGNGVLLALLLSGRTRRPSWPNQPGGRQRRRPRRPPRPTQPPGRPAARPPSRGGHPSPRPSPTHASSPQPHRPRHARHAHARAPTPTAPAADAHAEPQPSPTIVALDPDWLRYLNGFRAAAGLPALREDSAWSAESGLHSRYMVLSGDVGHSEDPSNPFYTNAGAVAGDMGNIAIGNLSSAPFEWAINYWLSAPFHAVPMLDPQLAVTGFGEYRDAGGVQAVGATLDVERGLGPLPAGVEFPIMWPGNDSTTWVLRYSLPEFPAALSHCTGYSQATGAPIILQLGDGRLTPNVTATTLLRDGEPLAHCQFDETNYTHPDAWTQRSARTILDQRDAIVLIPFAPLLPDATYAVRVDANGQTYTWSFRTAVGPP